MKKHEKSIKHVHSGNPISIEEEESILLMNLIKSGKLFRYHFPLEIGKKSKDSVWDEKTASEVAKLEHEFGCYTGHKYVIAVNSCGSALFLSLKAAKIQFQDKVFTNAFTFTAVPSSIVHAGGIPVYLECNSQYLIDIDDLKNQIELNPDVKFFVLSHMRGRVSDVDAVKTLCEEAGIYLIEDCAHSLGAKWYDKAQAKYKPVGYHGKIACFSTQSDKLLNSGEGGFIATDDENVAVYCILAAGSYENLYKQHISRPFNDKLFETLKPNVPNFSLRMSNLTAAVLRPQISTLDEKVVYYSKIYNQLIEILTPASNLFVPVPLEQALRVGDSLQFNLLNLTNVQADKFIKQTGGRGLKIQIFGRNDNSRYFKTWKYSYTSLPVLKKTDEIISFACDLKLTSLSIDDVNLVGYIIKDVLYKIVCEDNEADYREELTDNFRGVDEVICKYDAWVSHYDFEHRKNGWQILLNDLAYMLTLYLDHRSNILDVGCGTGLLGQELKSYNFKKLQGIDISELSLKTAKKLQIYENLLKVELGRKLVFENAFFDALVATGVFTRNQVPLNAFDELIRILKPKGFFVIVLRIEDSDFYYNKLKDYCNKNIMLEVSKTKISVLKNSHHEIIVLQKM